MQQLKTKKVEPPHVAHKETHYQLPDGSEITGATLKRYREEMLLYMSREFLSHETCKEMLEKIPPIEVVLIQKILRISIGIYGGNFETHFLDWVAISVIHTLERFRKNQEPPKSKWLPIPLWRDSTPNDVLQNIMRTATARGLLLPKTLPKNTVGNERFF